MEELNPMEVGTIETIEIPDVPADDVPPTVAEAAAMFAERPDCNAILTEEGWMRRDGSFA